MRNGPYELVRAPESYPGKRYRGRYAYEHIVRWWEKTGSVPSLGYEIHHKNGDHRDNRLSNLQLVTSTEHRKLHGADKKKRCSFIVSCATCNKDKEVRGNTYRHRIKHGYNFYCGRECQHKGLRKA